MHWRKKMIQSSWLVVSKKLTTERYEQQKNYSASLALMLLLAPVPYVQSAELNQQIAFNISQQRADLALTQFAEQADLTLLFSLDKVSNKTANKLVGRYPLEQAMNILLKDTGLIASLSAKGLLSINNKDNMGKTDNMLKKNTLSTAIVAILASTAAVNATAAEESKVNKQSKVEKEIEKITVTGIRGSLLRSLDVKRESGGVVDSISAEDIGKFPDTNLAESLQRITGVSIDRSGGEGQLITVRGFGPQFNTVLINGRQIASENQSRAFSFDTVAAELVKSLDVHKTSTATTQSGGIGATVNVNTARPFAISGFKMAGSVKGVYDENSGETTPQVSGLISNTFKDETFGVLLALSNQQRKTRLNQAQIDGWLENVGIQNPVTEAGQAYTGNIFSARNYDSRVTFEERTRTNANLVLQYAPSDNLIVTADALYSDFDVKTDAKSYGHWFTAPNVTGVNGTNPVVDENGTVIDMYQEVGLATDTHARKFDRLTNSKSFGLNFDWDVNDNLNMKFDLSTSNATRDPNNGGGDQLSLIGYANRVRFQMDDNILPLASMFESANPNIYSGQQEQEGVAYDPSVTPDGVQDFLNTDNSRAHVMLRRGWAVEDQINQFKWDGTWVNDGDGLAAVKFGVMYSSETKNLDRWDNEGSGAHCAFCGYPDEPNMDNVPQYVFDAGSDFLNGVSGSGRMPTSWLAHDAETNFSYLEGVKGNGFSFDAEKRNKSFEITEDTLSFYLEMDFESELAGMLFSSTAGFRYESTSTDVNGIDAPVSNLTILDETEMLAQFGAPESITQDNSYDVILPNFSARLEITDEIIARVAASKTLTRPTLDSMSPVTVINVTRQGGDLTSTSGNPALQPFTSDNFDLSLEWYYDETSYASIGYFRKLVSNFIVNSQANKTFALSDGTLLTDPSTGTDTGVPDSADGVAVFTNTLPNNGESATVNGWELALQHSFGETGFGVIANATLVSSDAELDAADISQIFALTGLSDSANLVGFYEKGPIQARLSWNWRDTFVQSLTQNIGDGPTIVEAYQQLDLSASYDLSETVSIFVEGINLTEEYVHKRGRFSNQLLLIEDSGRRWGFGVRGSF
jgi:iron complex outermembrane recepter protein